MGSYTPRLKLLKEYLEDVSDKRMEHPNWDIIDLLFHPVAGHIHDGEDSPEVYIDFTEIWAEFQKVWRTIEVLQVDAEKRQYFLEQFYEQFMRHNHTGVETIFTETFTDTRNTIMEHTDMILNPQYRFLTLPENYVGNRWYDWMGRPFYLNQDPDPDVTPTSAIANIVATNRGEFIPYLTVSNDPKIQNRNYVDAVPGQFIEMTKTDTKSSSVHSFAGRGADKRNGTNKIPHRAYHWYGLGLPPVSRFVKRFAENNEFTPAEYHRSFTKSVPGGRESIVDTSHLVTTDLPFTATENTYEEIPVSVPARPLYSANAPLSYYAKTNSFYWLDIASGMFDGISIEKLGPIHEDNMVEVAATEDEFGFIYVLKSWVEETETPAGHFHLKHQIIRWGGEIEPEHFEEGPIWKSGTFPRWYWKPRMIAPTHLEIVGDKLYIYTELSWLHQRHEGMGDMVNYYGETPNFQWFPFGKYYGNTYKQSAYVTMVYFNPAILGTVVGMNLGEKDTWVPKDIGKLVDGAFPFNNSHSVADRTFIRGFKGGNDDIYLGMDGEEMIFYSAFVPYDGDEILKYEYWKDPVWLEQNTDKAWHGIIRYNVLTGEKTLVQGTMPFRVNANGTLFQGDAWINNGVELVKQWVVEDETAPDSDVEGDSLSAYVMSTVNNTKPTNKTVLGSFWTARASAYASVSTDSGSLYAGATSSVKINTTNGSHTNISATATSSVKMTTSGGRAVASSSASVQVSGDGTSVRAEASAVVIVGGYQNTAPDKTRPPINCPPVTTTKKCNNPIVTGERACMHFKFVIGEITTDDIVKVHINARSGGRYPSGGGVPFEGAEWKGIRVLSWQTPDWALLRGGRIENDTDSVPVIADTSNIIRSGTVRLLLQSERRSDAARKIISTLHLNYIYITVERQGYIYKYTWDDMPQGDQAAMSIKAKAPARNRGGIAPGQNGIEILGVKTNVISSK